MTPVRLAIASTPDSASTIETKAIQMWPQPWLSGAMRCGSSCHSTLPDKSAAPEISTVMMIIPIAATSANLPVCFGPIRLNNPMIPIATIAHSPGESQSKSCRSCTLTAICTDVSGSVSA